MKIIPSKDVVALTTEGAWTIAQQKGTIEVVEKNQPEIGKIIALGYGKPPFKTSLHLGDVIAYRKFGEFKFYIEGKETIFVKYEDILAVLKREDI